MSNPFALVHGLTFFFNEDAQEDPMRLEAAQVNGPSAEFDIGPAFAKVASQGNKQCGRPEESTPPDEAAAPAPNANQEQQVSKTPITGNQDVSLPNDVVQAVIATKREPKSQPQEHSIPQTECFLEVVTKKIVENPLPTPVTTQKKQLDKSKFVIRRSKCIVASGGSVPALQRAQSVLMRKLGILVEQEHITPEAQEAYTRLFDHTLS